MATSKELLKSQEQGAEIRITIAGQPEGGKVEYAPRCKGDRKPWAYRTGQYTCYYAAGECMAAVKQGITGEVAEALRIVRQEIQGSTNPALRNALRTLYNAGVFSEIDAAGVNGNREQQ